MVVATPQKRAGSNAPAQSAVKKAGKKQKAALSPHAGNSCSAGELGETLPQAQITELKETVPVFDEIMKYFTESIKNPNKQIYEVLNESYPSEQHRLEFSKIIDDELPANPTAQYMEDVAVGKGCARPWMMSWDVNAGNHGDILHEFMENLVMLILLKGFCSNPETHPGFQFLTFSPPLAQKVYEQTYSYTHLDSSPNMLGIQELNEERGYARVCGLMFILHAAHKKNLFGDLKEYWGEEKTSQAGTLWGVTPDRASDHERVDANREQALIDSRTRSKPNAFNHIHQMNKKVLLGGAQEEMLAELTNPKTVKSVLGIGDMEAKAVLNMTTQMPSEAVRIFRRAANAHGMVRGVISHAGLSHRLLGVGNGPDMPTPGLKALMKNDNETVIFMALRIVHDFVALPTSMRKTLTLERIPAIQMTARGFLLAIEQLRSEIPDSTFATHKPLLINKFIQGVLDEGIEAMVESSTGETMDIEHVSAFRAVIATIKASQDEAVLNKSRELKLKLLAATHDEVTATIEKDMKALGNYYHEKEKAMRVSGDMAVGRQRLRYKDGLVATEMMMSSHVRFITLDSFSTLPAEFNGWKHVAQQVVTTVGGQTIVLVISDFSKHPTMEQIDELLASLQDILHQDHRHALFFMYPAMYPGMTAPRNIKACRRIEDRLMSHEVDINSEIGIQYVVDGQHGSDCRKLSSKGRLCVSEKVGEDSPWLTSEVYKYGKIENVPLIKVKDMACTVAVGPADPARALSPAERVQQKGSDACRTMLDAMLQGVRGLKANDKVLLLDTTPNQNSEWARACSEMQMQYMVGASIPLVLYAGTSIDKDNTAQLHNLMLGRLMRTWWPKQPEYERRNILAMTSIGPAVELPRLEAFSWVNDKPELPTQFAGKFADTPEYDQAWRAYLRQVTERVGKLVPNSSLPPGATIPDFTDNAPPPIQEVVLETVEVPEASVFLD